MPIDSAISIKDKNAQGVDTEFVRLDKNGIYDPVNSRYFSPYIERTWPLLAASVDSFIWTCTEGVWQLARATSVITVSGGSNAAVTLVHCAASVAIGSGTAQLTAVLDLEETAPNKQTGTLIATPNQFFPGDSLGVDFSGTLTGLVGCLTYVMKRVG